ncbi:MAG: hypothetical protein M3Y26_03860 [Actinomycetota bacterium]|nr:hypothetical protein [Actinomycetota bacterium]
MRRAARERATPRAVGELGRPGHRVGSVSAARPVNRPPYFLLELLGVFAVGGALEAITTPGIPGCRGVRRTRDGDPERAAVWAATALAFGIRIVAVVLHLNPPQPFHPGDHP